MEQMITPSTQAVILNSPNNPSGVVYTRETYQKLAAILNKKAAEYGHPIYIVSDEPYRELAYGVEVPFLPEIYRDTVICYSYSKSLSLPGERIGYVYVPQKATDGKPGIFPHLLLREPGNDSEEPAGIRGTDSLRRVVKYFPYYDGNGSGDS